MFTGTSTKRRRLRAIWCRISDACAIRFCRKEIARAPRAVIARRPLWVSVTGSPVLARVNQSAVLSRMRRDTGRFAVAPVRKRLPSTGASLYAATTTQGLRIRPVMSHQPTTRTNHTKAAGDHRDSNQEARRQQCDLAGGLVSGHGGALLKTTRIASNRFTGMANRLPVGLAAILRPSMRPTWKAISENGTNFQG